MVKIEVVPAEVAAEVSCRVNILLWSMGAGPGCDAQYLFASDMLGYTDGKVPRHSKLCRGFKAEYARLQAERVAAFQEYAAEVESGAFPEARHLVRMDPDELDAFMSRIVDSAPALRIVSRPDCAAHAGKGTARALSSPCRTAEARWIRPWTSRGVACR